MFKKHFEQLRSYRSFKLDFPSFQFMCFCTKLMYFFKFYILVWFSIYFNSYIENKNWGREEIKEKVYIYFAFNILVKTFQVKI